MIVCHEYKFIFLKTRKTAGTSIEAALENLCGPDDIVTPISPRDEALRKGSARNHRGRFNPLPELLVPGVDHGRTLRDAFRGRKFFNHMSAAQARNRLPASVWEGYFKFCFERNPWDKMISRFHWDNRGKETPLKWEEFLARGEFRSDFGLYTIDGALAVDFVGRYENLAEDLKAALTKVGAPAELELPKAKGGHRPKTEDGNRNDTGLNDTELNDTELNDSGTYHAYYDDAQRRIVARAFAAEIEMFGYEF